MLRQTPCAFHVVELCACPTPGGQPVCVRASLRCVTDTTDPNVQIVTAETGSDLATNIGAATTTHRLPSPGQAHGALEVHGIMEVSLYIHIYICVCVSYVSVPVAVQEEHRGAYWHI